MAMVVPFSHGEKRKKRQKAYLHDGRPEMHSLQANGTIPHALEPAGLGLTLGLGAGGALPSLGTVAEELLGAERRVGVAEGGAGRAVTGEHLLVKERPCGAVEIRCGSHLDFGVVRVIRKALMESSHGGRVVLCCRLSRCDLKP